MSVIIDPLIALLCLGGLLLLLMALLSPLEALGWWAGWGGDESRPGAYRLADEPPVAASTARSFVVYLTAIGGISAQELSGRERGFLSELEAQLTDVVLISDIFPFSVNNNPLNGERTLAWLWQRLHNGRLAGNPSIFTGLIFVRNLLQVGVSADPRFGPIYNVGVAREIIRSLLRKGYTPGSGAPISVLGWSGGGQIAVGVTRYISMALAAPVFIISIGGVLTDDPGIADAAHLYHLEGSRDKFPRVGDILYPGRWPFLRYSKWNKAKQAGLMTFIAPGPMKHTGRNDYFDHHAKLPSGQSHLEKTTEIVAGIIQQIGQPPD